MASSDLVIEAMDFESEFLPWIGDAWNPGEHISVIAPTGAGKTVFSGKVLDHCRKYVLVLDAKGGDSSLGEFGFPRLSQWPGVKRLEKIIDDNERKNLPSRFVVGNQASTEKQFAQLIGVLDKALEDAYEMGNWTIYADELMVLTDPRQFNLRARVDRILIAARDRGISFMGSFQSPSWVTPQAARQSTWIALSYTRDTDAVDRLAEIVGRPKAEIRGAVKGLEEYSWIVVGRNPREPLRVTRPTP